ncbi:hypothetical protein Agub_g13077, partial [Astrephomene gubernaculifera]
MDLTDPDQVAQLYVMQWMHENGMHDALRALEKHVGRLYDDGQLPEASQLMQLVWRHVEQQLQEEAEEEHQQEGGTTGITATTTGTGTGTNSGTGSSSSSQRRRQHQEEALRLLRAGAGDYAGEVVVADVPPEVHGGANVIAVRLVPGREEVITAAGDGWVRCVRFHRSTASTHGSAAAGVAPATAAATAASAAAAEAAEVVWATRVSNAALLSLALHPLYGCGFPLVAVGGMDGRVTVLYGPTGATLAAVQPHSKYVVRVAWGAPPPPPPVPQQQQQQPLLLLATASTDETVAVLRLDLDPAVVAAATAEGEQGGAARGNTGGRSSGSSGGGGQGEMVLDLSGLREDEVAGLKGRLNTVKQIPYGTAVADVAFLRDGRTLVVGVRGSNYLRLLDCRQLLAAPSAPLSETLVNMNEAGDDHVSFSARQLLPSHCGAYLLVCTDSPRLLVLRTSDWSLQRVLFGLPAEQFPQPTAAWHRDSNYIYASGGGPQLCVFHLGSGRLLASWRHHKVNLRDLHYDPQRNLLASCSFDKTVKLMG